MDAGAVIDHGPFSISASNGMPFQLFVFADGIVIVRPSLLKHLPGQLVSGLLGGAVGGGVGGGLEEAMTAKQFDGLDEAARALDCDSASQLARELSHSQLYPSNRVANVAVKKAKLIISLRDRQLRLLGGRKMYWRVGKDTGPLQASLRQAFGDRFSVIS